MRTLTAEQQAAVDRSKAIYAVQAAAMEPLRHALDTARTATQHWADHTDGTLYLINPDGGYLYGFPANGPTHDLIITAARTATRRLGLDPETLHIPIHRNPHDDAVPLYQALAGYAYACYGTGRRIPWDKTSIVCSVVIDSPHNVGVGFVSLTARTQQYLARAIHATVADLTEVAA